MNLTDLVLSEFTDQFKAIHPAIVALRLAAAVILGGIIGIEREVIADGAGLRTHILVSLAACLFAILAFEMLADPTGKGSDPLRLIEAVTAGVAFLAAGSIITSGGKIKGLTTGAGMWMAGAIGLACGVGNIVLGAMASVLAVVVLWMFRHLSRKLTNATDAAKR